MAVAKQEQVLQLDPATELRFKGPFTDVVTSDLNLQNPSDRKVCFKVKTTAPKRYCVRPNSGIIDPKSEVKVAVMLQPFDYDPSEKNKHKFMVQTMFAPDGPIESQENLWKDITPDQLMDSKLKCVFEMPETTEQDKTDGSAEANVNNVSPKTIPEKVSASKPVEADTELSKAKEEIKKLLREISELKEENHKLKDEGVRLRKVAMSDTVSSTPRPSPATPSGGDDNMQMLQNIPPVAYIILAVLIGLIFGKFLL
ncbi:vesicle-associated membrane protein/synaptobrevin-binding protein isoform X1 [Lingula anatina]|uniref:Vesicle-associated membrane protein/synaptobrevin-binding protein isoform X1 n=1 Tax=Lingula anatina TaxID=7574 RepID=A0A1S3JAK6_LINAN|nr:vesicle-associated membrane protein/synaptobrevin-binding protein isoform X1 [Lingula anatina]|eukprot:XP_013407432.1 vesicle-associated membrane protein/synaptobrevin-binding protein isoform X1 [Lingula anatina]